MLPRRSISAHLALICLLAAPLAGLAQSAAQWNQMKAACRNSGGKPSSEFYNDWVRLGGCICPPATTGSGKPTCSGSSSLPGGTPEQQLGALAGQMLFEAFFDNPTQRAMQREREEAAARQEQERREDARRREEQRRQAIRHEDDRKDRTRTLLLSSMKRADSAPLPAVAPAISRLEQIIQGMLSMAERLQWSAAERARLEASLRGLDLAGEIDSAKIDEAWRSILTRPSAEFERIAAEGQGPGFPGAGQQTNANDCAIFALANATGLPYGVVASRAGELIRDATWRTPGERADPQATIERAGLNGGEVIMLAESFGRARVVDPADFAGALREGKTVLVNVVPRGSSVDNGHQVALTRTFERNGQRWYEVMDSNQGPIRRLYVTASELDVMIKEKGIAWEADPGRTPALLRPSGH